MKILSRYVLKEHVGPLTFALTALTSLLLLNYIAKQFGNLVGKGLPWTVIGEFFLLSVPFTVAMTLPMAVLVATLYAFSRLASENEITALKASGVGMRRILVPVLWGAAGLALVMLAFNDQVLPRSNHKLRVLTGDIARKKPTFALREQVINEVVPGRYYLRAGHIDESSNQLREVVIYDLSEPSRWRTIYADSGTMGLTKDGRDLALTLFDGYMQELPTNDPGQLQRLFYTRDRMLVRNVGNSLDRSMNDTEKGEREKSVCELQQDFEQSVEDRRAAERDLERTIAAATHLALTGEPLPAAAAPKRATAHGLGWAYCALLSRFGVPDARAAMRDTAGQDAAAQAQAAPKPDTAPVVASESVSPRPAPGAQAPRSAQLPPSAGGVPTARPLPPSVGSPTRLSVYGEREANPHVMMSSVSPLVDAAQARLIATEQTMDAFDVEIHKKFSLAAACVVFVLLGAPIALRFPRGGVGLVISVSLGVFSLYYVLLIAGESLADRNLLSPFWAMWAADVLFGAVAALLLVRMGAEGATARGGDFGELWDNVRSRMARVLWHFGIRAERRHRV